MNTYTTPTGIKVLLPQVPIDARGFCKRHDGTIVYLHGQGMANMHGFIDLEFDKHTILGTCWREGKHIENDMDDIILGQLMGYYVDNKEGWNSWLLSIGEKIKEGHKIVVIKVE